MKEAVVLGIDIGASSGRGVIGKFDGEQLTMEEIHRFPNRPVTLFSSFYWDILSIFDEVKACLKKAKSHGCSLSSVGIDTWAQDFALLDSQGNLLGNPHHYRDRRTEGLPEKYAGILTEYELFSMTGMLPYNINTLYQLLAMKTTESALIAQADSLLFMADLINYFLTRNQAANSTIASVSLLYNQFEKKWDQAILSKFSIPPILPEILRPGEIAGYVSMDLASELGVGELPVVSVAAHDTSSAVASIPAKKDQIIYISCGTWSTIGTVTKAPVTGKEVFDCGFCNESGYGDENLFVKNITGLWILQECIAEWAEEGYEIDYDYLNQCAEDSRFDSVIDPDRAEFSYKGNMCGKVTEYLSRTGQARPESKEDLYRCIVLSLAMKYRQAIQQLETLLGKKYESIHIIGGGAKNKALCGLTSRLTGKCVYAGPYEATALGNIIVQLIAMKELGGMDEAVSVIERSVPLIAYNYGKSEMLDATYEKFLRIAAQPIEMKGK